MQQPLPGKPETERTNNTTITIMRTQTRRIRAMAAGMLAVVAMLLSPIASAAQIKVKGCVTDATGEPLIGVTVLVKGTAKGTSTDIDGNYALSDVADNSTLIFTYVGYKQVDENVKGRTTIDVTMHEDSEILNASNI